MSNRTIAVLLPVYIKDKPDWVKLSVDSILTQSYKDLKLFVGIDGPLEEDLGETLSEIGKNDRVVLFYFPENRGLACVLNDLLDYCFQEGFEIIARMDADDISMSDRFEKQMSFLDNHPEIDVVGGAIEEIDENGNVRGKSIIYPTTDEECRKFFAKRNPHAHPAVMFRKSFFDKLDGKKYRPEYRQNQDTMLWFDGMRVGTQHANVFDVVLKFRITDFMFKKRRNGWDFAKNQLKDRMMINRELGYGFMAYVYGIAMFLLLISPAWLKKIAYRVFR